MSAGMKQRRRMDMTTKELAEAGVTRIVMPDQNTYEGTVKHTRHGVFVNVPRHWAGEKVRVTIIKETNEKTF